MEKKAFENNLKKVMEHCDYESQDITVEECNKKDRWTPCDLVMREYYNNGCGSAKGFLGILPNTCEKMAQYIIEHQEELKAKDMYNKKGVSNFGFTLWDNYELH